MHRAFEQLFVRPFPTLGGTPAVLQASWARRHQENSDPGYARSSSELSLTLRIYILCSKVRKIESTSVELKACCFVLSALALGRPPWERIFMATGSIYHQGALSRHIMQT